MYKNFEKIEQKLNCKFPAEFKEYINTINKEEIVLDLFDDKYRILYSITKEEEEPKDWDEDVIDRSISQNRYFSEDEGFISLPFARILNGDGYVYLYFLCKEGEESNGEIYIRDADSPKTSRIRVSKNMELIKGEISEIGDKVMIDCKSKSFEDIMDYMTISNNISVWKDSFGIMSRENSAGGKVQIELSEVDATICEFEDNSEGIAKFEIHFTITTNKKIIFSSKAYEISIGGLKEQIENNINYRIFYHKFICCLDCLKETVAGLIENGEITMLEINQAFSMSTFINEVKKEFVEIGYGRY